MCAAALPLYRWSREIEPTVNGRTEYAWCLMNQARFSESKEMALEAVRAGGLVSLAAPDNRLRRRGDERA